MEYLDVSGVVRKAVIVTHIIIGLNVGGAELMLKRLIESHRERPDIEHYINHERPRNIFQIAQVTEKIAA
jgi:hypothetical protein